MALIFLKHLYWFITEILIPFAGSFQDTLSIFDGKIGRCFDRVLFSWYWKDEKKDEAVSSSPNIVWNSLFDMWKNNLVIVFRTLVEYTYTFFQCEGTISSSIWKLIRNVFAYFTFRTGASKFLVVWVLGFFCLFFCFFSLIMMQREEFQCKLLLKSCIIFILYLFQSSIYFSTSDLLANASSKPL